MDKFKCEECGAEVEVNSICDDICDDCYNDMHDNDDQEEDE